MLQALILLLGVCLFAIVAYYDIRTRRIPNEFIVGILALSSFRIALAGNPIAGLYTLAASAALFIATFCFSGAAFSAAAMSSSSEPRDCSSATTIFLSFCSL